MERRAFSVGRYFGKCFAGWWRAERKKGIRKMQVGGVSSSVSLLHAAVQQQNNTNILTKVHDVQKSQSGAAAAGGNAGGDEAEQGADGDERGGGFQAIA